MYQAQQGIQLTFHHPVRDINEAFVAGQAAAVTKTLLGPDRAAATGAELAACVLSDHAVTGWVVVRVTLPRLGEYTLTLANPAPPTADGGTTDYEILVSPGVAVATNLLTSRDRVRTRLQLKNNSNLPITPGDAHELDALIDLLVSEVSDEYQGSLLGRNFAEADQTDYLDGTGRASLVLSHGPVVSWTSLESVDYQDDGAGGVTEARTLVPRYSYVVAGLASQPRYSGRGRIDLLGTGAFFTRGPRRYRAVYRSGFASVPEAIVGVATTDVVYRIGMSTIAHLVANILGDGQVTYLRPAQMQEQREMALTPYRLEAA